MRRCTRSSPLSRHPAPLDTERLQLRPRGPEHATALFESLRAPEVWRFLPSEPPPSLEALWERFRRTATGPSDDAERWWNWAASRHVAPEQILGSVEISLCDDGRYANLAYVFARQAWGHGYAREACAAVLDYLARETPVTLVDALVDTRNARSIALLERLHFDRVATLRCADVFKGATSDEYRYAWRPSRSRV